MSIPASALLPFIHRALDDMVRILETLGDERVNQRPGLPQANSPYSIVTHCAGVTEYWLGHVLAKRPLNRDREAEFEAQGTVAQIRQVVRQLQQQIEVDLPPIAGDQPVGEPVDLHGDLQEHTQGEVLLHWYRELTQHLGQLELTRDILLHLPEQ
ncbi:MAG: hypothetical protein ETSY2_29755 [Candidatus Entotheonella gemina]|uniref:DinB-like domain-containing protein n=1 Tax=Candidatus Entotheonella gemina TaxID=1429439 RepID=W4M291_9BACT|nr:MAG: hypothetical protein ETSY2_29755 [Candidatus Entotheonella gemina]